MKSRNALTRSFLTLLLGLSALAGCSRDTASQSESDQPVTETVAATAAADLLLVSEPAGAGGVIAVRQQASDGDDVVVVGRIGGSENPWIEGRAAFSIVDNSLKACSDIEGDGCPVPWDYCCETSRLADASALVKVVDADGNLIAEDAKQLLGVRELSTVVAKGKAQRDEAGNLTVLASAIYVKAK
jgi:hypothetical protein